MKVIVDGKIYDSHSDCMLIQFNPTERDQIRDMAPDARRYLLCPSGTPAPYMHQLMQTWRAALDLHQQQLVQLFQCYADETEIERLETKIAKLKQEIQDEQTPTG